MPELRRYNIYKSLQVVYNNYMGKYDDVLALDNKLKTHQRHLQFLAIETYKSKNTLKRKHSETRNKFINF